MANFKIVHDKEFLINAKSYSVEMAIQYGLEKAIIYETLKKLDGFKKSEAIQYFPEFTQQSVEKHIDEMLELGFMK